MFSRRWLALLRGRCFGFSVRSRVRTRPGATDWVMVNSLVRAEGMGRRRLSHPPPAQALLVDGEALLGPVADEGLLPGVEAGREVALRRERLAHRLGVARVGVVHVGQPVELGVDGGGDAGEQLV